MSIYIFTISLSPSWSSEKPFNLVLDLDYTLFHLVDEKVSERTIMASDKKLYEPIAWGVEGIENVIARGIKVSFFSGGEEVRNISLLKQVKLSDGRSLYDIADKVYSRKDLEVVSSEGRFSERFKKNLKILGFDLERTLLVDDLENFVPVSQKRNILWLGKAYHHFNNFDLAEKALKDAKFQLKYIPATRDQWFISTNKMKYIMELVLDAKENTSSSEEVLSYIQENKNKYIPYDEVISSEFSHLVDPQSTPNICFRHFRLFKLK